MGTRIPSEGKEKVDNLLCDMEIQKKSGGSGTVGEAIDDPGLHVG